MIERFEYDAPTDPHAGVNDDEPAVPYHVSHAPKVVALDPELQQLHELLGRYLTVDKVAKQLRARVEDLHTVLSGRGAIDAQLAAKVAKALKVARRKKG